MSIPKKQFSRPSISIGDQSRSWSVIVAQKISVGDLLPDFGQIVQASTSDTVTLVNPVGLRKQLAYDEKVFVFTHA